MRTSKGGIAAEPAGRSVWLQRAAQCAVQCGVSMHAAQVVVRIGGLRGCRKVVAGTRSWLARKAALSVALGAQLCSPGCTTAGRARNSALNATAR
jgi:hypothetical protein